MREEDASASRVQRAPRDHDAGVMPRAPLSTSADEPLWVFGYGSIVWRVGFEHDDVVASERAVVEHDGAAEVDACVEPTSPLRHRRVPVEWTPPTRRGSS